MNRRLHRSCHAKSHRLIQVAGGGTRSTPMKKLCVCGKTVRVTEIELLTRRKEEMRNGRKTVKLKVALWRDSRKKRKSSGPPENSYPHPMHLTKNLQIWLTGALYFMPLPLYFMRGRRAGFIFLDRAFVRACPVRRCGRHPDARHLSPHRAQQQSDLDGRHAVRSVGANCVP
jgi:hypothetical protein